MKICIMTSVHRHDDVRIYHKEAKALRESGHEVTILCPDFEGRDENGIVFKKVKLFKGRIGRMLFASMAFYKAAVLVEAQVYHFHDPELIGCGKKLLKKGYVIYDVHEDVPRQILTKPYLKPKSAEFFSKWFEKRENKAFTALDIIVTAAPVIENRVKKFTQNTMMVCNYPKLEEFKAESVDFSKRENKVCYIGGITKIRGAIEMLDAMEKTSYGVSLALAGEYETPELKSEMEAHDGFQKVEYLGFLDREGIQKLLNSSKAGLVTLHPTKTYVESLPVKMFEYMMAQIPVIASDFPYWQGIIEEAECGICVNPLEPAEIAKAVSYICDNDDYAKAMGKRGRKAVLEKYNWDMEKRKLIAIYEYLKTQPSKQKG